MRLATVQSPSGPRAAVVASDETLVPVAELVPGAPSDMLGLIDGGSELLRQLGSASQRAQGGQPVQGAELLAPIPRPRRPVLCIGWNYSEHFIEGQGMRGPAGSEPQQIPDYPTIFSKNPWTVVGPEAPVWHSSPVSEQLDWEVELAVIIGRAGRDIADDQALQHVFGYTVANDVSVRDVQRRHGNQWFKGKNFDSHCPLGPWIVTADEIADPHALRITSRINGVTKQDSNTRHMVFKIPRILRELSAGMRLLPGDIISTGTPEGVGFARKPPEFLAVGDVMEMEVERIGVLRNTVRAYDGRGAESAAH